MVQVRAHQPINTDGSINLEAWLDHVIGLDPALDRDAMREACEFARQVEQQANAAQNLWVEGTSSFQTGLEIAEILADLKLDQDSLIAAVLYRGVREGQIQLPDVNQRFGPVVAKLIEGVLRMAAISASLNPRQSLVLGTQAQVENLRKMLVAMVDDVRVALIKLAERTCEGVQRQGLAWLSGARQGRGALGGRVPRYREWKAGSAALSEIGIEGLPADWPTHAAYSAAPASIAATGCCCCRPMHSCGWAGTAERGHA